MFPKSLRMPKKINFSLKRSTSFIVVLMIVAATISSVWAASRINVPAVGAGSSFKIPVAQKGGQYFNYRADNALVSKNAISKAAKITVRSNAANTPPIINPAEKITKQVWNGSAYADSYTMKDPNEVLKYQIVVTMPQDTSDYKSIIIEDILPDVLTLAAILENSVSVSADGIDLNGTGYSSIDKTYYNTTIRFIIMNEVVLTSLARKNIYMTIDTKLIDTKCTGPIINYARVDGNSALDRESDTSTVYIEHPAYDQPIFSDNITSGTELEHLTSQRLVTSLKHLNNSGKTENLAMIVAVYAPDQRIVYKGIDVHEINPGQSKEFKVSIDMLENADGSFVTKGYYAKVFLWDSVTFAPIIPAFMLK